VKERKVMKKEGRPCYAVERISPTDEFRVKLLTAIMDSLEINLKEGAIMYSNAAKRYVFLANLQASEKYLCEGVNFLIRDYTDDVNIVTDLLKASLGDRLLGAF
jgi:hypothetical protein